MKLSCLLIIFISLPGISQIDNLEIAIHTALNNNPGNNINNKKEMKRVLTKEVKSQWFEWITNYQTSIIYKKELEAYSRAREIAFLKKEMGDISSLERAFTNIDYLNIKNIYFESISDYLQSYSRLQELLFTSDTIIPTKNTMNLYQIERSIHLDTAKINSNHKKYIKEINIKSLRTKLDAIYARYLIFEDEFLDDLFLVTELSEMKYEKQDIDYAEFLQSFSMAIELNIEYLNIIKEYNKTAVELEYYLNL